MKSRFLIFTLFLAVMCLGSASNAMAQSATGTGVIPLGDGNTPLIVTVSAQQGGNGGIMRVSQGQAQIIAHPVDQCVQGNTAWVIAEITHSSGDFAGSDGQFLVAGFVDNGKDGDFVLALFSGEGTLSLVFPDHPPACDLFLAPAFPLPLERGGFQVKP